MKKFYVMAAFAAAFVGMTSCNNDDEVVNNSTPNQLQVTAVGLEGIQSRAGITATSFTNGEKLGLYIYRGEGIDATDNAYNDASSSIPTVNVSYNENGGSWAATSQGIILSSTVGKVYAYYPYAAANATNDGKTIPMTVAETQGTGQSDGTKDQDQTDYMWATPVSGISNANNTVELQMNHALAMVSFKFVQTTDNTVLYPGEGKVSSIVLKNKTGKEAIKAGSATLHIGTGAIADAAASENGITLTPDATATLMNVTDAAKLPRLLLYPSAVAEGDAEVTVTVDGNAYTLTIPAITDGYVAGKNYEYTFTLKGTGLEVTEVSIAEWIPVEQTGGDIETPDSAN